MHECNITVGDLIAYQLKEYSGLIIMECNLQVQNHLYIHNIIHIVKKPPKGIPLKEYYG